MWLSAAQCALTRPAALSFFHTTLCLKHKGGES